MNILEFLNTINLTATAKFKIYKNPGIQIKQLREIENEFDIKLPNDLVEFYTSSNGLEGDDDIFNIIPFEKTGRDIDDLGGYLIFSEYMIYSETCGLEIDPTDNNKYRIFTTSIYPIENGIIKRKYVADTLVDFIKLYSRQGTLGIWGNEVEKRESNNDEAKPVDESIFEANEFLPIENKKPWWKFW